MYINRIAKDSSIYCPGVFYCKTAFDGLRVINKLMSEERTQFISDWQQKLDQWEEKQTQRIEPTRIPSSDIRPVSPPTPPHINKRIRLESEQIDLTKIWNFINKKSLFCTFMGYSWQRSQRLKQR